MAILNTQPAQAYAAPEAGALRSDITHAVHYPLHEGTGTAIACALGRGPALTLQGGGTPWATWGRVTPNGTDNVVAGPGTNAELNGLFRLDTLAVGQMIVWGHRNQHDNSQTSNEVQWWFGLGSGGQNGWGADLTSAFAYRLIVRGIAGASNLASTSSGGNLNTADDYNTVAVLYATAAGIAAMRRIRVNLTTREVTYSQLSEGIVLAGNGSAPPNASSGGTLTIGGIQNNVGAYAQLLNSQGSNNKVSDFWACRMNSSLGDTVLSQIESIALEYPREPTLWLKGAV